jgi:signal transduction histidine kinase
MIQKLFNTSVFRLSLVYALLFSTVAAGALGFIYWVAAAQMQQQTDDRLQLETDALLSRYHNNAVDGLVQIIQVRNSEGSEHFLISNLVSREQQDFTHDLEFESLSSDHTQAFATLPLSKILGTRPKDEPVRLLLTILPGGYQLLVVTDLKAQHALLNRLLFTVLSAIGLIFTLAIVGGSFVGYNVLHRINTVGKTANEIISGNLSQRMPVTTRNDEFDRLSRVLNTMLERIEHLMQGMRDVTDNLAHDLRNPLNRLRNRLEASQFQPSKKTDYPQVIQDTIQDVDDLIKTFNALLSIAQMESGVQREDWIDVDLTTLTDELAELYTVVAEEQGMTLSHRTEHGLYVHGNRQLLAQAMTNLLDNAVKYSPPDGHIHLCVTEQDGKTTITVADNGPGIPEDKRKQVFKRFTRLDNARSTPGNGLGLSLVKAVADLHGAVIQLQDNHPGLKASLIFAR